MIDWMTVDWSSPADKISRYFRVREALWLPKWNRLAYAGDGLDDHVKARICALAERLDVVRDFLGRPMIVHCWFRPKGYNALVHGSRGSKHMSLGPWSAVDFHCELPSTKSISEACATVRAAIEFKLEAWGLRCEDFDGPWVHLDDAPVVTRRFFKP